MFELTDGVDINPGPLGEDFLTESGSPPGDLEPLTDGHVWTKIHGATVIHRPGTFPEGPEGLTASGYGVGLLCAMARSAIRP